MRSTTLTINVKKLIQPLAQDIDPTSREQKKRAAQGEAIRKLLEFYYPGAISENVIFEHEKSLDPEVPSPTPIYTPLLSLAKNIHPFPFLGSFLKELEEAARSSSELFISLVSDSETENLRLAKTADSTKVSLYDRWVATLSLAEAVLTPIIRYELERIIEKSERRFDFTISVTTRIAELPKTTPQKRGIVKVPAVSSSKIPAIAEPKEEEKTSQLKQQAKPISSYLSGLLWSLDDPRNSFQLGKATRKSKLHTPCRRFTTQE